MPHVVAVPREKWCPLGGVRLHWVMLRREITGMSMPRRTVVFPAGHPGRRVESWGTPTPKGYTRVTDCR